MEQMTVVSLVRLAIRLIHFIGVSGKDTYMDILLAFSSWVFLCTYLKGNRSRTCLNVFNCPGPLFIYSIQMEEEGRLPLKM